MSEGSNGYASGSPSGSDFGSPPHGSPLQTRLKPAEVHCYLEEGLGGVGHHQYRNAKSFGTAINREIREFQLGGPAQMLRKPTPISLYPGPQGLGGARSLERR